MIKKEVLSMVVCFQIIGELYIYVNYSWYLFYIPIFLAF